MAKNITFTDNTTAEADEVNEVGMQRIINNATPTSTTATTLQTFATLAVPAGEVQQHIMIQATMIAGFQYVNSSGLGSSSQIDIYIGEGGSEASKYAKTIADNNSTTDQAGKIHTTVVFYYEPTSDEKTNGFNVIIKGKTTNVSTGSGNYCGYDKCDIFAG